MRRRIALVLIKLAHKVYPPKITEMPTEYVPVGAAFDRPTAGIAGGRPISTDAATAAAKLGADPLNWRVARVPELRYDE
ncbi:hypothetical protein SEA_XAVIA_68 [Mycobacterium phage Xavia]|uniref:Uncharacterized protein n=1 Tax=Mycobacterium phage Xavia TaxID=2178923 RepID=A0A2U8UHK4_9CAUD|nr:hypothetical protein I5J51_gp68 [Mycobacterium phage Xavia]AWN02668.1 hypothetical protein SEA_XAVIA_68 [Mycobacterium phage Xavia]